MAPICLDNHVGGRPNPLYNKGSLIRLFTFQHDDNAQDEAIRAGHQKYPQVEAPKSTISLKCDAALGCGTLESRSYKARTWARAVESSFETDASKTSKQKQEPSHMDDSTRLEEYYDEDISPFERDRRIHASKKNKNKQELSHTIYQENNEYEKENEDEEVVSRVCQYSTGSRYGYLIDHCPEFQQSAPPHPHFVSRARHIQTYPETSHGVRVDLTLGTITLIMVFLLLIAIMLVEIVDIVFDSRRTSSPEGGRRGRSRTRRALARAFGVPRKVFVDNPENEKETTGLGVSLER
ncbi:uncharacterized protein TRUGW13939_09370 [Talaromyces rugulosus]|uniref:Uncharacterized protein n=1 Tax=Talaromyces rugulosus TaxID=121627 RepID=A0A7H8R920_TALRU|nr:uncharacterized protein TRUGW13939_09370 [Talaromyces rugulosus]QKX62211.1 hypothetical protein TRUGW13939_09370 [Talaromyces rugulosus]